MNRWPRWSKPEQAFAPSSRTISSSPSCAAPALWAAGAPAIIASSTTFIATLYLPIHAAVGIGIALSAMLYVYTSSGDVSVVELIERENGDVVEAPLDTTIRSCSISIAPLVSKNLRQCSVREKFDDRRVLGCR
jgi:hypothetical protein